MPGLSKSYLVCTVFHRKPKPGNAFSLTAEE